MTTVPEQRPHLDAILTTLRAHAEGRFTVCDGERPATVDAPAVVVYLIDGGQLDGPVADPEADADVVVQLTCIGREQGEAALVRDQATRIMRTQAIDVTDRTVIRVRTQGLAGVNRDDQAQPPRFYATPRFTLSTTPT